MRDYPNGTKVRMRPSHPHHGKTGIVIAQPGENEDTPSDMYLVQLEGAWLGCAFAYRRDIMGTTK